MTNREKFIEVFGDNPQRHHITKSWWDEEYVLPQESKTEKVIKMRDATPEERESVDEYVKSISNPTGIDFWDLEHEPCEDCISRHDIEMCLTTNITDRAIEDYIRVIRVRIRNLPPVTPTRPTGHWIRWYEEVATDKSTSHIPHCKCSKCDTHYDPYSSRFIKFCPNCGARMVEQERSNDNDKGY